MSVSAEIIDFIKQTLLPEISEIKSDIAESKSESRERFASIHAELKVTNGRLDLMEKGINQFQLQMTELKNDIREVRSYVWSGGRETGHMVHEAQSEYKTGDREG